MRNKNKDDDSVVTGYGFAAFAVGLVAVLVLAPTILSNTSVLDLLASATSSFGGGSTTTLFFIPYGDETITPGDTTSIDINLNTRVPINALGATITFSSSTLEVVGISKEKSVFNLWTEDTSISEDDGQVHFSGGTTQQGGIMGTGTLLTLTVRAKGAGGKTQLSFSSVQAYPSDGSGKAVVTEVHPITYNIQTMTRAGVISGGGASVGPVMANPDLNGDGKVNLVDISIMMIKIVAGYDPRFDLNADGVVNLGDLATLLSKLGTSNN